MHRTYTILVSAAGGDIGQGVLRSVRLTGKAARLIGTDITPDAAGLYSSDRGYVVPKAREVKKYLRAMAAVCTKEKVDLAFICNEEEQSVIASHCAFLQKRTGTIFVVQPRSVLDISMDKLRTYAFLKERGVRVPETAATIRGARALIRAHGFPLVLKSRRGSGGKHMRIIRSKKEFATFWRGVPNPLLQEYIGGARDEEYTVGVFLDRHSRACGSFSMRRMLRFGLTWTGVAGAFPDVSRLAIRAAEAVGAVGPCNVQLRRDSRGRLYVLEVNARISSTAPFRTLLGFNEASASMDLFLHGRRPVFTVKRGFCMRTWGELVVASARRARLMRNGVITNR